MTKGDIVSGHFCSSCLRSVDTAKASASNPYKTAACISCRHRSEGLDSTGVVGDWLIIGKSEPAREES